MPILAKNGNFQKMNVVRKQKTPAASMKRRKWGLGVSIHIHMQFEFVDMPFIFVNLYQNTVSV